jgi:benzoyl-CoA reductase subunit C
MSEKFFNGWQGESLDTALQLCRDTVEDPELPTLRAWRDRGGRVLGHFQVYFPEEIAHAAGLLPFKVRGFPIEPTHADSHFGSYLCSILKTSLEAALSGHLELDLFVTHPICDAARNLGAIWGRNFKYPCEILYLPQNPNSSHSVTYLREEYERLRQSIGAISISGKAPDDASLSASIELFNENRRLLHELYRLKRETPWLVSAEDAYCLVALAGMIPREEHNEFLQFVLSQLPRRTARKEDRVRVVFEGGFCEQPPLDLIRMLGRSCYIVDDDLLIGLRYLTAPVATEGDPLQALASAYLHNSSYSPVQHDLTKRKDDMLMKRLREAKGEAVIVCAAKMCEPGLEEQVAYADRLEKEHIPYFISEFEENMTSFEHLEMQVETFLENLMFA